MPQGPSPRRTTTWLACGAALLLAPLAGCQRFPVRYAEVTPDATARPTTRVNPSAAEPAAPRELPALPASPIASQAPVVRPGDLDAAPPAAEAEDAPTPLLDAALARAGGVRTDTEARAVQPVVLPEAPAGPALKPVSRSTPEPEAIAPPTQAPEEKPAPVAVVEPPAPAQKPIDPEASAAPVAPRDEWADGLSRLRALARSRSGEPGEAAEAWAIRSRVLDWLAGERRDGDGQSDQVWNSVLAALSTATSPETPDASALAHHLSAAVLCLEAYTPLQTTALHLCRKVQGFGLFDPVDGQPLRAGQPLLLYCEMEGLKYEPGDGVFRSRLSSRVEVVPAGGGPPVLSEALGTAEDVCRRRRRDYYVNYRVVLPPTLAPGTYALRLVQTDLIAEKSVTAEVPLTIAP